MARSLVLGNGSVLVCMDNRGQVRDFYFDYVGRENHMTHECVNRIGIWVDGVFSWFDDQAWDIKIDYKKETLVSAVKAANKNLEIEVNFTDAVYNEKNIFVRNLQVRNLMNKKRTVKIFLNHQFHLYGVRIGDTAYYDPNDNTIIHYKGRRIALIGGRKGDASFDDYTVGLFGLPGKEGTWRDAEDGYLAKSPTENGSVDSTVCFGDDVDASSEYEFSCWVVFAKTLREAKELHKYVLEKTPKYLIESTHDFWNAWVNKLNFSFYGLSDGVVNLFKKSLLIIRTHCDNTGPIIASGDSGLLERALDTYGYIWTRDASFISIVLDKAGYFEASRRYFNFANEVVSEEGFFFLKYRPDRSLGGSTHAWIKDGKAILPIQEDETALVLYALWRHYELTHDLEFIEYIYNSLIKKAAEFMTNYRDEKTRLPGPSFDLWEMRWGISTFTSATIFAALNAASNFAKLLGKEKDEEKYLRAAGEIKEGILKYLYNEKSGFFYKLIEVRNDKILHDETIDMSSFYGVFHFNVVDVNDPIIARAIEIIKDKLVVKTEIGGVARFEGDEYYRRDSNITGNPWFITTLWLAQYYLAIGKNEEELTKVKEYLEWTVKYAQNSGILSEQIDGYSGSQLSASPLIWSHAAFVSTVIKYLEKLEELGICKVCLPTK